MDVIQLTHPYAQEDLVKRDQVLALGFFDGLHLGHQEVIRKGRQEADDLGLPLAVMTFNRHPSLVFKSIHPDDFHYLTSLDQKIEGMSALDVDYLYIVDFTSSLGKLSPKEFIDQYIINFSAKTVVAGYDYSFGQPGIANVALLEKMSAGRFKVLCVKEKKMEGHDSVSSSQIRYYLNEGKIREANELLGRPYEIRGYVIHGQARGRTLGFPTANIYPDPDLLIPAIGVYASRIQVQGRWYDSMTSVGYNLTFEKRDQYSIEAYILDFDQDIYGENIRLEWVDWMRGEVKFDKIEGLVDQLKIDEKNTRQILKNY